MDKKQQAFEDWKKGMKYQEIADKYGISLSTVKSWAVRYWKKNETKKVATGEKKVATTTAKKLQLLEKKGGAPKGNKNHLKHGIYEKILFEFLSQEEQELFLQQEIDEVEECKKMIRFCDLQILKFMRKIKELEEKLEEAEKEKEEAIKTEEFENLNQTTREWFKVHLSSKCKKYNYKTLRNKYGERSWSGCSVVTNTILAEDVGSVSSTYII